MAALKYTGIALAALLSTTVNAKQFWSDTSFTLLKGNDYEVIDADQTVFTWEHASGHTWGSTFVFIDRLKSNDTDNHEVYGEVGFNFNFYDSKDSFVKEAYVTPQWEFVTNAGFSFNNYLLGAGVNLNVPGSTYFNVNLYQRNNQYGDNNQQLTLVWAFPFADGFVYDGFVDAVNGYYSGQFGNTDSRVGGYNFTSQFKYDLGQHIGVTKSKLFVGIEYVMWHNKFGISGVDEKNANLLIKWHL